MDLLRGMIANRKAHAGVVPDPKPRKKDTGRKKTKTEKAKEHTPGTKDMRAFIVEEKPTTKIVKEHLQAIADEECATSSDEE